MTSPHSPKQTSTEYIAREIVLGPDKSMIGMIEAPKVISDDAQILIRNIKSALDAERTRVEEAEAKLDNFSQAITVVSCKSCKNGYRFREMADGLCAKCLKSALAEAQKALAHETDMGMQMEHVIGLQKETITKLREALEKYADESNWGNGGWEGHPNDYFRCVKAEVNRGWDIAKQALEEER